MIKKDPTVTIQDQTGSVRRRLKWAGLRLTRQRLALGCLLFEQRHRHVTAETFHREAVGVGIKVSLATIYNTLHQFTGAGLLREVAVDGGKTYFDTNTDDHHHFYRAHDGILEDIPANHIKVSDLPPPPKGALIDRVDVIVRLKKDDLS